MLLSVNAVTDASRVESSRHVLVALIIFPIPPSDLLFEGRHI